MNKDRFCGRKELGKLATVTSGEGEPFFLLNIRYEKEA